MMGIPDDECDEIGHVVGLKTIVNEFAAYKKLSEYVADGLISVHVFIDINVINDYLVIFFSRNDPKPSRHTHCVVFQIRDQLVSKLLLLGH